MSKLVAAFDHDGYTYALENTTNNLFPTPFAGKVVPVTDEGVQEIAVFADCNDLRSGRRSVCSNVGFAPPIVLGEVVRITVPLVE